MTDVGVAVVGAGRMGGAMAARLRDAGVNVVVYNRTSARAAELASRVGVGVATTAREAAAWGEVVLVSLADDEAVRRTYAGADGLVAGLRPAAVVVETSTIDPETVRDLSPHVAARGATLLDAPVSGSVPLVERGELTFMVGGPDEALDRVRPVLNVLARQVFHVGAQGAGSVVKLATNLVIHALNQALSEALVLAERAGVPRATAYEVFAASAVAAPFVHYKRPAFEHPEQTPVAFTLDLVAKDLELIERLGQRVGAQLRQTHTNAEVVRAAVAAGLGDHDMSALARFLSQ
ncbi:MAG TPA: NAD(P)-dependent oxidoreductase [Micromonosporaceae bacterium]|jgi:3-hydroxyisobutyrate dehydrogenase-like beta-hydroxyacid dehydrogenase